MLLKTPKMNTLADGLTERTSSMLDEIALKLSIKMKKVIDTGKRSKTISEVKPVKNMSENLQSFLDITPEQNEVLPSHKLQDHVYE